MHRELTAKFLKDELSKMIELFPEEKRAIEYRYEHSLRVASIALDIAKKEGLDEDRCYIGALLHDLGYSVPYDNPKEYVNHGRIGAKLARPFLESLGYSEEEVNEICYGIAIHVDDKADFEGKRTASKRSRTAWRASYAFTLPASSPDTKCFCAKKNTK